MSDATQTQPGAVLITGANGYIGRLLLQSLAADPSHLGPIIGADLGMPKQPVEGVTHTVLDITDGEAVKAAFEAHRVDTVVHLAAVVTPRPGQSREDQRRVDVDGTRHVLEACVASGAAKFVYTSSGAAYGYSGENSVLLDEADPLRGNEVFAYSWHKRLVEELLAEYRGTHPELKQLVFRVSTILGPTVRNQITAMFERPVVLGLKGVDTPFCFVWDQDVVACLEAGVRDAEKHGTFNLTGDGVMTLREIAVAMKRRYMALPERWIAKGLEVLSARGWAPYGPEQTLFLRHRPVMANQRLKDDFGFMPRKSSREVFEAYRASRA
jgi:UDP-glucose 4-epimerase